MPKFFRPWQPEQTTLLPPSPRDWLSDNHQVYLLLNLVDKLDLSAILIPAQVKDPRGEEGFDPRIERACHEDLSTDIENCATSDTEK